MAKAPAVSVIVPIYNVEQYVKLCVDSILAQTFQDFEIILVDDASPDNSYALCQKLYDGNDKVKFIRHEKNQGLGASRNTGIKHAAGKYVYFVDSDDYILPDALEKLYNAAEKNNAQVVHAAGRYELIQKDGETLDKNNPVLKWDDYEQEGFLKFDVRYRLDNHWKTYNTRSNAWLCFCLRDFLAENKIEFLPIISEDEPFSFALFCTAERYYILHEAFYVHLLRGGSIMRSYDIARFSKGIYAMIAGSMYIERILNKIPKFDGFDQWRGSFMAEFFDRFLNNHTAPFYKEFPITALVNETATKTLSPVFGASTSFVKYFFDGFHIFRRQAQLLALQSQLLLNENKQLKTHTPTFTREQSALLEIIAAVKSTDKRIFLIGTPEHGNLGDQAIVLGELRILENYFPEHKIIEIQRNYLMGESGELFWGLGFEKYIRRDDIIFYHGGGNLGNLWSSNEILRRLIIERFPDNKIVIFPQSICFTNDADGLKEREISTRIYNAHKDLHLMARDENSFNLARKIFPAIHNYLLPDAATVMHGIMDDVDIKREGVLFILRGDKEKVRDDTKIKMLQATFNKLKIPFAVTDTVIKGKVTAEDREQKVRAVLAQVRKSKLVITDRFHGVVFSFITRTPVLAFKSFDTKISSGIKWFEQFQSVFYAEEQDLNGIGNFIQRALSGEAPFAEMNPAVKFNSRELFRDALNQIIRTSPLVHSVILKAPPRLQPPTDNRIKRVFTLHPPLSICNFRCHYCYLAQRAESYQGIQPQMKYSPEQVTLALSPKRLGGLALFNVCSEGETLLLKDLDIYMKRLVEEGHYVEIVTNCTITPMLDKILAWDKELLAHVEFKCSFHWLELQKRKMLELFARNVNKIWDAGASACVEITPSDELIPYIDEIKEFSLKNFGALPHITIARDDRTKGIDILSKLPKEEYYKIWGQFDSPFFNYKASIFGKRQEEFCHAGIWSAWINMATGQAKACYCGKELGDVFANPDSEFPTWPVGKCSIAHCYNGHFWLTFGDIPDQTQFTYADMRNRVRADGREWLQPKLREAFNSKLSDSNRELSDAEKLQFMIMNRLGL